MSKNQEFGWVCRRDGGITVEFWGRVSKDSVGWVKDMYSALRFARQADAEFVIALYKLHDAKALDYVFLKDPSNALPLDEINGELVILASRVKDFPDLLQRVELANVKTPGKFTWDSTFQGWRLNSSTWALADEK